MVGKIGIEDSKKAKICGEYGLIPHQRLESKKANSYVRKIGCAIGSSLSTKSFLFHYNDSIFYYGNGFICMIDPKENNRCINAHINFWPLSVRENIVYSDEFGQYDLAQCRWIKEPIKARTRIMYMIQCDKYLFCRFEDANYNRTGTLGIYDPEIDACSSWSGYQWENKDYRRKSLSRVSGFFEGFREAVYSVGKLYMLFYASNTLSLGDRRLIAEIRVLTIGSRLEPILLSVYNTGLPMRELVADQDHLYSCYKVWGKDRVALVKIDKRSLENGREPRVIHGEHEQDCTVQRLLIYRDMLLTLNESEFLGYYKDDLSDANFSKLGFTRYATVWNDTLISKDENTIIQWTEPDNWSPKSHDMYSIDTRAGIKELVLIHRLGKGEGLRRLPRDIFHLICLRFARINWTSIVERDTKDE